MIGVFLLHGGNPLDELLVAAAGAAFLIGGWLAIRSAPSPEAPSDQEPTADEEASDQGVAAHP